MRCSRLSSCGFLLALAPTVHARSDGHNAAPHVRDERIRLRRRAGRAADVANPVEDRGEIVRVEREDAGRRGEVSKSCDRLTLRHRADVADALGDDEIRLERGDSGDVDLIHAAIVAECGANRSIDLPAREASEVVARTRQPGPARDAWRVIAAMRNPNQPILEPERTDDFGRAGE